MIRRGHDLAGAVFSDCERYRYRLWRAWDPSKPRLVWCMLNPSTADETVLDPTLRRVDDYTKRWGYGAFDVVNIFAWRATDPRQLALVGDPVGPDNETQILWAATPAHRVVVGWGTPKTPLVREQARRVAQLLTAYRRTVCLRTNKDGSPVHPLYQPAALEMQHWEAA